MEIAQERLARLALLAKKAWPSSDEPRVTIGMARDACVEDDALGLYASVSCHPRALDALEAALLVLAGEVPPWVEQLAQSWLDEADRIPKYEKYDHSVKHVKAAVLVGERCYRTLANKLLAAAKAGAR